MELRRLRYFLAVAEELSFTRAAAALHMAQPPLSSQIRALEAELGVTLFDRSRRTISLTAAGRALVPEARRVLDDTEQAVRITRRAGDGTVGRLAIGFVPAAACGVLPQTLRRYRQQFPAVELSLQEHAPDDLIRHLHERRIDVALLYAPFFDDAVSTKRLSKEHLVVALPRDHELVSPKELDIRTVATYPLILPTRHETPGLYSRIKLMFDEWQITPTVVQRDVWMMQTIIGLVAGHVGLAIVPSATTTLRHDEVEYRALTHRVPQVEMTAAWLRDATSPTLHAFVTTLRSSSIRIPHPVAKPGP